MSPISAIVIAERLDPALVETWREAIAGGAVGEAILVLPRTATSSRALRRRELAAGVRVVRAPLGRASQLNAGARVASGSTLLFLHGDTRVPLGSLRSLSRAVAENPLGAFAFSLAFDRPGRAFRVLEALAAVRDRLRPRPLGDQGLALPRALFEATGGYPDVPLLEDVRLSGAIRRAGGLSVLEAPAYTSGARLERDGILFSLVRNAWILALDAAGVPERPLAARYYGPRYLDRWERADPARSRSPARRDAVLRAGPVKRLLLVAFCLLSPAALGPAWAVDHTHARFDEVLSRYVDDGWVDYAALQRAARDSSSAFVQYLAELSTAEEDERSWSREARLAYWINAYNAFTLALIVDHYPIGARWYMYVFPFLRFFLPTNSILMIGGRWDDITFASVRGPITLGAIEHEILRAELAEPRIHFAIVCASIGCPTLRGRAFRAEDVGEMLDRATADFVSDSRKVRARTDEVEVSKIFGWFREDFDEPPTETPPAGVPYERFGDEAGVARWLAAYGTVELVERLRVGPHRIGHMSYDWKLNDTAVRDE